jgi:hypothetical protein
MLHNSELRASKIRYTYTHIVSLHH